MVAWENADSFDESRVFVLPDGRRLGYAEYGKPGGMPVFYFHGFPGSRLEGRSLAAAANQAGVRLIASDRPGIGFSDYQPGRTLLDWPKDVAALADGLGIGHFAVLGHSGGGPYTLICTYALPERISRAAVVAGLGPLDVPGITRQALPFFRLSYWAIQQAPWLASFAVRVMRFAVSLHGSLSVLLSAKWMSKPDRSLFFGSQEARRREVDVAREAFRQGAQGEIADLLSYRQWGFRLEHIQVAVQFWHGEQDGIVPLAMGKFQADRIAASELRTFEAEGHYTLLVNQGEQILRLLTAD